MSDKKEDKMTIIAFSGDLDKTLAALILAASAASMGMEVSIFLLSGVLISLRRTKGLLEARAQ